MGQDRNIFDKVYKRCELFLQENPQTYLKHFSIFKKVKTKLDTIPPFKFRHFYSLLFLFYFYFSGIQLMLGTLFTLNLKSLQPLCLRFRCHLLKFHMLMCTLVDVIITPATNCNKWNFFTHWTDDVFWCKSLAFSRIFHSSLLWGWKIEFPLIWKHCQYPMCKF